VGLNLSNKTIIFIDTAPFIYYFENHLDFAEKIEKIFLEVYQKNIQIVTSFITYIEIITVPKRMNKENLIAKYRDFFTNSENISLFPLTIQVAEETAFFRAHYKLRTPDAIQLATAKICGADCIITNDKTWQQVKNLKIITLDELP
jgi:predicted nucleic acid-binding protein